MKQIFALLLFCGALSLFCGPAGAQSKPLDNKPWDIGVWVGGGVSVQGGTKDTQAINAGLRLGKVLTEDHLGGALRGNFEWAADLMPVYYVKQPGKSAYGAGLNPLNLKWNFTSGTRAVPYFEVGGGVLFTNTEVPAFTSTTNFLTHAAFGLHFFTSGNRAFTASARYEHISNAGLAVPNPGVNTVQFTVGYNWFK